MALKLKNVAIILNTLKHKQSFPIIAKRNSSSWPPPHIKSKMEAMQRDDGVPVYLKGGLTDKVLFMITIVLTIGGLADGLYSLTLLGKKK